MQHREVELDPVSLLRVGISLDQLICVHGDVVESADGLVEDWND